MTNTMRAVVYGIAALLAGLVLFQLESALRMPGFWNGSLSIAHGWDATVVIGGGLYLGLPIIVLVVASMRARGGLSFMTSCAVPCAWVCLLFLAWAWRPWQYYREFPWWGVGRQLLPLLVVACGTGAVFWLGSGVRSNPRLQRTALRTAAEPPGR